MAILDGRWDSGAMGARPATKSSTLALDGTLMSVPVDVQREGVPSRPARPSRCSRPVCLLAFGGGTALPWYMVSRDGQRFLMSTEPTSQRRSRSRSL